MPLDRMFTRMTERLLFEQRVTGFYMQGDAEFPTEDEQLAFAQAFDNKTARKGGGRNLLWGDWLVESLFPVQLYRVEHQSNLRSLINDKRLHEVEGFEGYSNYNCSFGRIARPRDEMLPEGFMNFLLDRWRGKYRGMPQYYFDVEYPEWVLQPLSGRPDIPKTGRTAVSCVMNYGFHYLNGEANISIILRHLNWSHGWGDVYGGAALLQAVCKELSIAIGKVTIFANSASMDEPKIAKHYLKLTGMTNRNDKDQ